MLMTLLLPTVSGIELDTVTHEEGAIHLSLQTTEPQAGCPVCGQISQEVHSHYGRSVADLPWAGMPVNATLWVRRFFCRNVDCKRKIFCERLNPAIAPYARRTRRLHNQLQQLALALGGEAGSQLIVILGMLASPATLLRMINAMEIDKRPTPRVLGVDDWAKRKGQTYGRLLVDLERRQVVDLLAERSSAALAKWLQEHPGVEIISRDRAEVYAQGAAIGAPDAIQIADRFHLIGNLADALKRMFDNHASDLRAAANQATVPESSISGQAAGDHSSSTLLSTGVPARPPADGDLQPVVDGALGDQATPMQRSKSVAELRFDEVKLLQKQGLSERAIAQKLSMSRQTVHRYIKSEAYRHRTPGRQSRSKASSFLPYLHKRWQEGCTNVKMLFAEIQREGFTGSYASLWRLVSRSLSTDTSIEPAKPPEPVVLRLSATQAAWLLVRKPEELSAKQKALQQALLNVSSIATHAYPLAQTFRQFINEHQADALDPWL